MRIYYFDKDIKVISSEFLDNWKDVFTKTKANVQPLPDEKARRNQKTIIIIEGFLREWAKPLESTAKNFLFKLREIGLNHFWLYGKKSYSKQFIEILQLKEYEKLNYIVDSVQEVIQRVDKLSFVLKLRNNNVICEMVINKYDVNSSKKNANNKIKLCWFIVNYLANLSKVQKEINNIMESSNRPADKFSLSVDLNIDYITLEWRNKTNKYFTKTIDELRLTNESFRESTDQLLRESSYIYNFIAKNYPTVNQLLRSLTEPIERQKLKDLINLDIERENLFKELWNILENNYFYLNQIDDISRRVIYLFEHLTLDQNIKREKALKLIAEKVNITTGAVEQILIRKRQLKTKTRAPK